MALTGFLNLIKAPIIQNIAGSKKGYRSLSVFLKKTLVKLRLKRLGHKNPFFVLYLAIRGINNWAPKEANYVSQHCAFLRQMQTTATARKRGSVHSLWQINHCLGLGHRIGGNDYEAVEGNFWWVTKAALNRSLARQNFF
ncbi:MAG: hypothetical protein A2527_08095 [Candidatus Lambdaproteobacteria bacterium RIFOXYD2_FULL_50_16]|uniref:Uncharacterized protein n=1 Tax=Candidatus Lambdaproteobacteria bacterium RIFOXYD2_FULL_50_16 TaxID=1817772 RepID=A0A1F6GAI5_9PROT|nr:MAG: hypothetical protein A2527_08095 [Candidatus Lambdaproteobacteria bacterium RIFOXYD2_FULL_50_16]